MAGEPTALPSQRLLVLDFDGVLVDLHIGENFRPQLERRLQELFQNSHANLQFRPLLKTLDATLAEIAQSDVQRSEELRQQAWQIITDIEQQAVATATLRPGVVEFLQRTQELPKILYSNNHQEVVEAVLRRFNIPSETFVAIVGRQRAASLKPSAQPLLPYLKPDYREIFLIGDHRYDIASALMLQEYCNKEKGGAKVVPIGLYKNQQNRLELEEAGAWFLLTDLAACLPFVLNKPISASLSLVYLAYNEAGSIVAAYEDAKRFCELYVPNYQIVIVDDGSNDTTSEIVGKLATPRLRLIRHPQNLGMGAGMQSGYEAASSDYIAHLPADRQVRPQMLIEYLPHLAPHKVVLSRYQPIPLGWQRAMMSELFRLLVKYLGGLQVNFAGTYIFHRSLLPSQRLLQSFSRTFLFSFELLQQCKKSGVVFHYVTIAPFRRDIGSSREANTRRIIRIIGEILKCRWRH